MRKYILLITIILQIIIFLFSCKKESNPVSGINTSNSVFKIVFVLNSNLCSIDSDGRNFHTFSTGSVVPRDADLSPDGLKVVYAGVDTTYQQIFLLDLITLEITNITNDNVFHEQPKYSRDGKTLIFLTAQGWLNNIFSKNLETGELTQLTENLNCYEPSYSSDGMKITFWLNNGGDSVGVVTMDRNGNNKYLITGSGYAPIYFPNGQKILYQHPTSAYDEGLFSMNINGSDKKFLTNIPWQTYPKISSDGLKIVFTNYISNYDIFIINSDGGNTVNLTRDTTAEYQPSFSPDGSKIFFVSRDTTRISSLEIMNIDGGERKAIISSSADIYSPTY